MIQVSGYPELSQFVGTSDKFLVKGVDLATKKVLEYEATLQYSEHIAMLKVRTSNYTMLCPVAHRFLTTDLPYPFSAVPLTSMFWIRACDLLPGMKIVVAPFGLCQSATNAGQQAKGHKLMWAAITAVAPAADFVNYGVKVIGSNNYILNCMVNRSYGEN